MKIKNENKYMLTNQIERLAVLTNKDDHKDNYTENIWKTKERFDERTEVTYEIHYDDLIYYFKGYTARKSFDNFNDGLEFFTKMQSIEMRLEEKKPCRMYLNQI